MDSTRRVFDCSPRTLLDAAGESLRALLPHSASPASDQIRSIIDRSVGIFTASAAPRGVTDRVGVSEFEEIYRGRGENDRETPLEEVIQEADCLELFAVTIGHEVSDHIGRFFSSGELAEGYILDQIASCATDELANVAAEGLADREVKGAESVALPYSPGYCGWDVSGQKALFDRLRPEEIGVTLSDSCLMHPIKTVSGVLVLAPISAHDFSPAFPCCATCTTLACQERIEGLKAR